MGSSACSFRSRGAFNVVRGSRRPVKDAVAMFLSTCHVFVAFPNAGWLRGIIPPHSEHLGSLCLRARPRMADFFVACLRRRYLAELSRVMMTVAFSRLCALSPRRVGPNCAIGGAASFFFS